MIRASLDAHHEKDRLPVDTTTIEMITGAGVPFEATTVDVHRFQTYAPITTLSHPTETTSENR